IRTVIAKGGMNFYDHWIRAIGDENADELEKLLRPFTAFPKLWYLSAVRRTNDWKARHSL
ncbi:hypothetical protein ACFLU6_05410, partial [Acidobacteriota bacterium]